MTKSWRHWCPYGCGKSVIWFYSRRSGVFICEKCRKEVGHGLTELNALYNRIETPEQAQI